MSPHRSHGVRQSVADGLVEIAGTISMSRRRAEELHRLVNGDPELHADIQALVEHLETTSHHISAFRHRLVG